MEGGNEYKLERRRYVMDIVKWENRNRLDNVQDGNKYFQGNSSLDQTNSSLEAAAIAILTAVQQLGRLSYKHVTFQGDCKVWCVVKATIYVNIESQDSVSFNIYMWKT